MLKDLMRKSERLVDAESKLSQVEDLIYDTVDEAVARIENGDTYASPSCLLTRKVANAIGLDWAEIEDNFYRARTDIMEGIKNEEN